MQIYGVVAAGDLKSNALIEAENLRVFLIDSEANRSDSHQQIFGQLSHASMSVALAPFSGIDVDSLDISGPWSLGDDVSLKDQPIVFNQDPTSSLTNPAGSALAKSGTVLG